MNTIKHLKNDYIKVNNIVYKPYTLHELPANFGCIGWQRDPDGNITKEGISEWIKYKGYVYIAE
tara:strand:- start:699 stop:890 length:192 start_codon:yes stop_codon:yes gene_type:complete